jgi:hypothetical protein
MPSPYVKWVAIVTAITSVCAIVLSIGWHVPYIYTFVGVSALVLGGHLITIDDEMPGGFSNPDGSEPFPWAELLVKAAVLLVLGLAALVPGVRALGR